MLAPCSQCQTELREQYNSPTPTGLQSSELGVPENHTLDVVGERKGHFALQLLSQAFLEASLPLLLRDLKYAEALVLLQKFVLGPNLLSETVQLLLLLFRAQVDAGHGADDLAHLLELSFEGVQVLVDVRAVLVHAFDDVVN